MPALELLSVSKRFRRRTGFFRRTAKEIHALEAVSLAVEAREVHVLVGPNGSGKTTLLKLVSTILLPDAGRILVAGTDTRTQADTVRRHVGFAIANERSFFPRLTVRENLEFFAALENVPRRERPERVRRAMDQTGVAECRDRLAYQLSSGMCQRVGVARALLKHPSVLLLDEPTRSVDPGGAAQFWQLVRDLAAAETAVLLATHNFEEALAVADSVAVLRRGVLVAQERVTASTRVEELRALYFHEAEESIAEARGAQ